MFICITVRMVLFSFFHWKESKVGTITVWDIWDQHFGCFSYLSDELFFFSVRFPFTFTHRIPYSPLIQREGLVPADQLDISSLSSVKLGHVGILAGIRTRPRKKIRLLPHY